MLGTLLLTLVLLVVLLCCVCRDGCNGAAKWVVTDALNRSRVTGTPPTAYLVLDESDAPPTYRPEVLDKTPTITKRTRGRERAAARREHANVASSTSVHSPQSKAEDEAKVGAEAKDGDEAEAMSPWKLELAKRRTKQASAQATPSKPEGAPLGVGRGHDLPDLPDLRIDLPTALRDLRVEMAAASSSSKQLDCIEAFVKRCSSYTSIPDGDSVLVTSLKLTEAQAQDLVAQIEHPYRRREAVQLLLRVMEPSARAGWQARSAAEFFLAGGLTPHMLHSS